MELLGIALLTVLVANIVGFTAIHFIAKHQEDKIDEYEESDNK